MKLDRDAPYVQIIEHYRREIAAGRLSDGDMLPSGREIAAEFGVSMATAAKVATGLQALGLVVARPGAGTVVTAPRPPADRARRRTAADRAWPSRPGDGRGTRPRVMEAGVVAAPQAVAVQLGIEPPARGHTTAAGDGPGRRDGHGADIVVPGAAGRRRCLGCSKAEPLARARRVPASLGGGLGRRHGRRRQPRPGSSGSSAARRSWSCTAAGWTPTTRSSSTPSWSPGPTPG